ncbi:MAG: HAMP domain-containing sensor histidine kinase, partial [Litorimonas sp.]
RLILPSPVPSSNQNGQDRLELLVPCAAIGAELRAYAGRIALLSLLIAVFVGALIYFAMLRLIVRPVQRLAEDMTAFREAPEVRRNSKPSLRRDEIGQLQREFHEMKQSLRAAFRQRERLASLGLSVTKINHDLRNVLSTALLMADRLSTHSDPQLAEMGERLTRTVERGVGLTEEVLDYSSAREPEPQSERVQLGRVVADLQLDMRTAFPRIWVANRIGREVWVMADPEQLYRILSNLARNAAQAMVEAGTREPRIVMEADLVADTAILRVEDNGPGLPDTVEDRLFLPFTRGTSEGSTGLGLSISKELAEGMGGSLELLDTSETGTSFILGLPLAA